MTTEQQLRALTELVHAIRPGWDRAGIYAAVHAASATRDIANVAHASIDAARDATAQTPRVIATRDRHWQPTLGRQLPPPPIHTPRSPDEIARRGATLARETLAKARTRVDDEPNAQPPPQDTP